MGVGIAGGISTALLIVLFIINVFTNIKKSPARRRRLLCWITSMPMVVSILSLFIFLIPRASDICDTVKQVYLPFVLMHFVDLALLIQGGEEGVLNEVVEVHAPFSLCQPPCCFFGICVHDLTFTKIRLRIVKGLVYQAPVLQFVLIIIMNVLDHADFLEKKTSDKLFQFFALLNILAFMFGIWGFNILNAALSPMLRTKWKRYILRTKVLSAFVVILKMQNFILGILYFANVIPCIIPYISPSIMRKNIDPGYLGYRPRVTCCGQVIACVVADNLALAQRASRLVKVTYRPSAGPTIITIQDAIDNNSFYEGHARQIIKGNVDAALPNAQHVLEGTFQMAGQEHFYLETQAVLVVPKGEDGELDVTCSTQNPSEVQQVVAEVLGLPANRVVCRVKRMGGGFGGKETRSAMLAAPAAVASFRLQRPVRCMLDRDEDMMITGTRHPFMARYKVGFDSTGKITALDVQLFSNGGNTMDLSRGIMERAVFHIDNAYQIDNLRCHGIVCRTNLPSNTAFRGFGGPQGMAVIENVMTDVATYLNMDPLAVRSLNLYREGDETHYNQRLEYCTLDRCWSECQALARTDQRRKEIDNFNRAHRFKKRGMALIPTKFGIAFTALFLNQAGALVHVYKDGSVLLTHGGTEMGQGLHTKMLQVASRSLNIPVDLIFISETSTDKVPNTSPTAASAGSDLNGMAVLNACQILMDRLVPIRKANPEGTWQQWIQDAYFQRISLSTTGFYKTPDIGYDFVTNKGTPFRYFTFGAACSVVEVDCLTGNHRVLRTDIVMDLGESLNPAIDIGQVEGGFVQGLGLFTLEEPLFSPSNGQVMTRGPSNYKIPSADDIPEEFNVSLLRGCPNPHAVYSSKAVGEPPLFLASSVFFAIKDAIHSARTEAGITGNFTINSPATSERIRMACEDDLIRKVSKPASGAFQPWAASV
ncbi:hypothetical protein OUZ56_029152 [Daphnia magna]|uniref:Xanthine dehydrogenase n=1 Tax=Daphnia magna TaxID=35525 RepID=A0ABR0B5Z9_9CRUS|nr:hypothetical protein OUZ56_029152 [Daphnia magna]